MVISGITFFLLSPCVYIVPESVANPFIEINATEILASFGVIAICSLVIGAGLFPFNENIIGNGGINNKIGVKIKSAWNKLCKKDYSTTTVQNTVTIEDVRFFQWIKRRDIENIMIIT